MRRHERRYVDEDVESERLRGLHQRQRMLHAGKIRLGREGEEPAGISGLTGQQSLSVFQTQVGIEGKIDHPAARTPRVFPNAVHRVVVVGGEHANRVRCEWITLSDQLDRGARVRGEAHHVDVGVGVEKRQDTMFCRGDGVGAGARGGVIGMRVAEEAGRHQRGVPRI